VVVQQVLFYSMIWLPPLVTLFIDVNVNDCQSNPTDICSRYKNISPATVDTLRIIAAVSSAATNTPTHTPRLAQPDLHFLRPVGRFKGWQHPGLVPATSRSIAYQCLALA
jgi:hypothetical protein